MKKTEWKSNHIQHLTEKETKKRSAQQTVPEHPRNRPAVRAAFQYAKTKKSAQPNTTNTAAYRTKPKKYTHLHNAEQRRGQEGKSARRGDGLRNYECFPFSQTAARQSAPPKGNSAARECQNIRTTQYPDPTGRNSTVRKLRKEAPAHSPSQEARFPEIPHYLSRASVR